MKVGTTYKDIWKIAYPITLGMLAEKAIDLVDTAFMARVGEAELGAAGLGGVFYLLTTVFGFAIAMGAQVLMARNAGKGLPHMIGKIFDHTLLLTLSFALVVFLFIFFVSPTLFDQILESDDIRRANNDYLQMRAFGLFFTMGAFSFRSFYVGIAHTRIITYSSILMAVVNIPLDYIFVFGYGSLPAMGIKGAAVASVIAEFMAFGLLWFVAARKSTYAQYLLFKTKRFSLSQIKSIINLAFPMMFQFALSVSAWYTLFLIIEKMGAMELAISNIVRVAYMALMVPVFGFSFAANSMVSNIIGQGKEYEVIALTKKVILLSLLVTLCIVVISLVFAKPMLMTISSDMSLIPEALKSFYVTCAALLIFSVAMIIFHSVVGTGATKEGMYIELLSIIVYLCYIYITAIILESNIEIVWACELLYWTMIGGGSFIYLRTGRWKKYINL